MGIRNWLAWQFSLNSSELPDQPIVLGGGQNLDPIPVQRAFFQNTVTGEDQLRQRVAFALSEIWVVGWQQIREVYAIPPYWRIFRDNAFANYRDILEAVTLNPAMGSYLNMANNNKGNPAYGTAANENYARELMQLFTLGLTQLNQDGSPVLDQNHKPVPTYSASVVPNMAKALTGWTYPTAPGAVTQDNNWSPYYIGRMFAVERNHDTTAKTIFGNITIPSGQTAEQDLVSVYVALMQQSTMAPFVCQQLIQHLVTSNPSPAYIQRVSNVFLDNGRGVRGDLRAVITAILTDPEARAGDDPGALTNPNFGHLREPVLFIANILRGLNATLGPNSLLNYGTAVLGQNPFYAPSVFSYFSPRFHTEKGLLGPEFQIYSTQTAADRANTINSALYGSLDGTMKPDDGSTKTDLTLFTGPTKELNRQSAGDLDTMLDSISRVFLHHSMSSNLYQAAYSAAQTAGDKKARAQAALYIVLTSGEYQIIK